VVRNLRVLATDQRTSAPRGEDGKPFAANFSLVTLEVTPKIAEKVAVMQTIGALSLSLRAIADNSAELERAIASGDITGPENTDPKAEKRMLMAIANRPADSSPTYTVGADVSRFQRSSVPGRKAVERPRETGDRVAEVIGSLAGAMSNRTPQPVRAASTQPAAPVGPVVRVARGNSVTIVSVGAK
jgi:pilus assembly protein CpaB